jgi:hypothetical protein
MHDGLPSTLPSSFGDNMVTKNGNSQIEHPEHEREKKRQYQGQLDGRCPAAAKKASGFAS